MDKPSPKALVEAAGISPSYASMILSGDRTPPRPLAIRIYRETGWKASCLASLSNDDIDVLERVDPWTPRAQDEAA